MLATFLILSLGMLIFTLIRRLSYWKTRGVPGPFPLPLVGNLGAALLGKKSMVDVYVNIYRKYEGYPFVGIYRTMSPCLLIREPELIKNIVVKDFNHFLDNDVPVNKKIDPIFGRNPFVLRGTEWRNKRQQLTPHFTPGKMKAMFPIMDEVGNQMVKYINEKISNGTVLHEVREICVRFALDNVAVCAFGLDGRCFQEEYSMFRKLADDFLSPGNLQSIKCSLVFTLPPVSQLLGIKFLKDAVEHQLISMIRQTLEERRKTKTVRNDYLDLMAELYPDRTNPDHDIEVVANAATFFLDGYETSSRVMSFVLFDLARHPECQRKVREEINKQCELFGGKLTYECIQAMPYLDACINESMRMYPVLAILSKVCTQQYTYTCTDPEYKNLTVTIEPGTTLILPVIALHYDEKYYKSPNEFIPERFLGKNDINKYCFLPFGEGPRNCLGLRFGFTQVKLGVAHLIKNFELTANSKTKVPLEFEKWYILLAPKDGLYVDFKKI